MIVWADKREKFCWIDLKTRRGRWVTPNDFKAMIRWLGCHFCFAKLSCIGESVVYPFWRHWESQSSVPHVVAPRCLFSLSPQRSPSSMMIILFISSGHTNRKERQEPQSFPRQIACFHAAMLPHCQRFVTLRRMTDSLPVPHILRGRIHDGFDHHDFPWCLLGSPLIGGRQRREIAATLRTVSHAGVDWCADASDVLVLLILLVRWCCWCADVVLVFLQNM